MKIIIPGIPIPQARMRHSNIRGNSRVWDPNWKDKIRLREFLSKLPTQEFTHPRISFLFCMPILASTKKSELNLYKSGTVKHEKKPDIDNLVKFSMDILDNIFFVGDQRVSLGVCIKIYHPEPQTVIWIEETTAILQPWEVDFHKI